MRRNIKRRLQIIILLAAASGLVFLSGCAAKKGCGCGNNVNVYKPRKFNK